MLRGHVKGKRGLHTYWTYLPIRDAIAHGVISMPVVPFAVSSMPDGFRGFACSAPQARKIENSPYMDGFLLASL